MKNVNEADATQTAAAPPDAARASAREVAVRVAGRLPFTSRVTRSLHDSVYSLMPYRKMFWDSYRVLQPRMGMRALVVGAGAGCFRDFVAARNVPVLEWRLVEQELNWNSVLRLPHADESFESVICINSLPQPQDLDKALEEFARVLLPHGQLLFMEHSVEAATRRVARDHLKRVQNVWGPWRRLRALFALAIAVPVQLAVSAFEAIGRADAKVTLKHDFARILDHPALEAGSLQMTCAGQGRIGLFRKQRKRRLQHTVPQLGFKVAETEGEIRAAKRLRFEVLCARRGYLDSGSYPLGLEGDEFDACATHFVALSSNEKVLGTVRLILESSRGLHIDKYFRQARSAYKVPHGALVAEISRLSVAPAPRIVSWRVPFGLYKVAYDYSVEEGINWWYAILDRGLRRRYERLGFPFVRIGEFQACLGGLTAPYVLDLRLMMTNLERVNPRLFAFLNKPFGGVVSGLSQV